MRGWNESENDRGRLCRTVVPRFTPFYARYFDYGIKTMANQSSYMLDNECYGTALEELCLQEPLATRRRASGMTRTDGDLARDGGAFAALRVPRFFARLFRPGTPVQTENPRSTVGSIRRE